MATRKATPETARRTPRAPMGQEPLSDAPAAQPVEARRPAMKKITIQHVTRIEGHAKITIKLDDAGQVIDTQFHVTQIRGFEKFVEGRPYYEMPSITSRICGICPVSHLLASSKACDAIMAVRIPNTAA
jgi:coenzyme F420-reducing hydrogenase alpha subunit